MIKSIGSLTNTFVELLNGKKALAVTVDAGIDGVVNKFGYNQDIDTGTVPEDVWTPGGAYPYALFNTPQTLEIISLSADDALGGIGVETIIIQGLDADFEVQEIEIDMNGLTAVPLPGTWTAVNRMFTLLSGSSGENAGNINCQISGGGAIVSQIARRIAISTSIEGKGQTEQAVFRVPAGKTMQIKKLFATIEDAAGTQVVTELIRVNADGITKRVLGTFYVTEATPLQREYLEGGPTFTEGTWAIIRVQEVSSSGVGMSAEFDAIITGGE